jgi:transcriptional regulator with XRE-family HTH domain
MPRTTPPVLSLTLTLLRSARGWTQKDLAKATGIPSSVLSDYEKGRRSLPRAKLQTLAAALGMEPEATEMSIFCAGFFQPEEETEEVGSPMELDEAERRLVRRASALAARYAGERIQSEMPRLLQARKIRQARKEAEDLWERLKPYSPRERRVLIEGVREFQTWALCEKLCAESERAAPADAGRAMELADLALRVALRVTGEEDWRLQVQGYVWAFIGNARRVAGDLAGSDEAFARVALLWRSTASVHRVLDEGRVLDLEASLRKHQGRFAEALALHERALTFTSPTDSGYILLNKAFTLEQMENYEDALATLQQAEAVVDEGREPRLMCVLRFNLAVNLCHLGRYEDAAILIPEIRRLAIQLGNGLDLIRVLWLDGRISAGLERRAEAITALEQVRMELIFRGIAYDVALVSLELAALYLEERRNEEVKVLCHQMAPIFRAQGVHREALAALRLFSEAVERDAATVEMAQRLVSYLERARHDEQLRFEE